MNPPTGLAITAFYSQGDWDGYCHIKWTSPAQPAEDYYRIEYHDIASATWIWLTDVPADQDSYGIGVRFATAPAGGTPKSRIVDQVRITAKDVAGVSADAAATINTPTSITLNHVVASNFIPTCNGKIGDVTGSIDFIWNDLTMFVRNGRITLTKYGVTSPGVKRVLYDSTFTAVSSEYGPNRTHVPISLFPPGVKLDSNLTWDPINPPVNDPDAPFWVVETDLLTLTLTTFADNDPNPKTAEFTFEYYREAGLVPIVEVFVELMTNSLQLQIVQDSYLDILITASAAVVSGLPPGLTFNPSTLIISGTPTLPGHYETIFDITSKGNKVTRQTIGLNAVVLIDRALEWPPITAPPQSVVLIRGLAYPPEFSLYAQGSGVFQIVTGTLPAGLSLNLTTGVITGTPTDLTHGTDVTFQRKSVINWGPPYTVTFNVVQGVPPAFAEGTPNATLITLRNTGPISTSVNYTYVVVGNFDNGAISVSASSSIHANDPLGPHSFVTITWPDVGALTYDLYRTTAGTTTSTTGIIAPGVAGIPGRSLQFKDFGAVGDGSTVPQIQPPAAPPVVNAFLGEMFAYRLTPDQKADDYQAFDLPNGLILSEGVITGVPDCLPGNYNIYVQAKNLWGWGPMFAIILNVDVNIPVISSAGTADAIINEPFFYQIVATGHPTFFDADGLPDGLDVNSYTGVISGIPTGLSSNAINLFAVNRAGSGTSTLTLNIKLPDVPVIDTTVLNGRALTLDINESFVFQPSASNNPTRWSAEPLAQGLNFNAATGNLSGQFITNGFYSIVFVAYNAGGGSAPVTFYFLVGVQQPPNGTPPPPPPPAQLPIDVVDLWVNLDSSTVSIDGPSSSEAEMTVKRGDSTLITVIFHKGGVPQDITINALYFGAKVGYDDDYIVYSTAFTRIDAGKYRTYPDFSDQNNDLDEILSADKVELIGEIQWDTSDGIRRSTQTFGVMVLRDLLHPDPSLS